MKKQENQKIKSTKASQKYDDLQPRTFSSKAYLGCDICKLKNIDLKKIKSTSKLSDFVSFQDKNKPKQSIVERDKIGRKAKIKLTDLCDEDKKRIVELIEELSKFGEKNQKLKESLEHLQKTKQEQQNYIIKQANLHLQEKNFYVNEINEYKNKINLFENEIKNKTLQWENHEKFMNTELAYFAKALQKSLKEKNELNNQLNRLKLCLRQSLESFQRLKIEMTDLQCQDKLLQKLKSTSCQTDIKIEIPEEQNKFSVESDNEGFSSNNTQNPVNSKSCLDIINAKLEDVYHLLRRKGEMVANHHLQKLDTDLSLLLKNFKMSKESDQGLEKMNPTDISKKQENRNYFEENGYKFLKPFDQCSKTSVQAERILQKIEKPLNIFTGKCSKQVSDNKMDNFGYKKYSGRFETSETNVYQNNTVQKDIFKAPEGIQNLEDRLLEELFYSDKNLYRGLENIFNSESIKEK